ncbi:hypothetical protein ACFFX0_17860 [Citricoccus parietis]|uniref:Secreted protein n=1 Tax=Citricoccus parietis TaxID=592307 RepID=A0ABV5G207_9MICC
MCAAGVCRTAGAAVADGAASNAATAAAGTRAPPSTMRRRSTRGKALMRTTLGTDAAPAVGPYRGRIARSRHRPGGGRRQRTDPKTARTARVAATISRVV